MEQILNMPQCMIYFFSTVPIRNSDLEENVSDSSLDKDVEGGEKIKDVKEINNKQTPSLSVQT
jgi:hypothetical protein